MTTAENQNENENENEDERRSRLNGKQSIWLVDFMRAEYVSSKMNDSQFAKYATKKSKSAPFWDRDITAGNVAGKREDLGIPNNYPNPIRASFTEEHLKKLEVMYDLISNVGGTRFHSLMEDLIKMPRNEEYKSKSLEAARELDRLLVSKAKF